MLQRILVVDDDLSILKVLRGYLEQGGYTVLTATDGEQALHMLRHERVDLLVLDVMLPQHDGWEITRRIRADDTLAAMPIIMLTARVEDSDKIIGLELGADDYVTKPFNAREVLARVRALLRRTELGNARGAAHLLTVGGLQLDVTDYSVTIDTVPIDLTRTEFKLLQLLMENAGHTLTRDELLIKVMGYAYEGMGRTLDTHIRNLRKKIEANPDNPRYIQTMYGIGYRLTGARE